MKEFSHVIKLLFVLVGINWSENATQKGFDVDIMDISSCKAVRQLNLLRVMIITL